MHPNHLRRWFRSYTHHNQSLFSLKMPSGRWYPGVATLPDAKARGERQGRRQPQTEQRVPVASGEVQARVGLHPGLRPCSTLSCCWRAQDQRVRSLKRRRCWW